MLTWENLVQVLEQNPSAEVEVDYDDLVDNSIDYTDVAKAAEREFRMIQSTRSTPDSTLELITRRIVFEPKTGTN